MAGLGGDPVSPLPAMGQRFGAVSPELVSGHDRALIVRLCACVWFLVLSAISFRDVNGLLEDIAAGRAGPGAVAGGGAASGRGAQCGRGRAVASCVDPIALRASPVASDRRGNRWSDGPKARQPAARDALDHVKTTANVTLDGQVATARGAAAAKRFSPWTEPPANPRPLVWPRARNLTLPNSMPRPHVALLMTRNPKVTQVLFALGMISADVGFVQDGVRHRRVDSRW